MEALSRIRLTLGTVLELQAKRYADRPLVTVLDEEGRGQWLSYGEFDRLVNRLARGLTPLGVERDGFVCLLLRNRIEYLLTSYALKKLGAVEVAINAEFRGAVLARAIELTHAPIV